MAIFQFEAMDAAGSEVKDRIDAASQADAQRQLRERGYFVTRLREVIGVPAESPGEVQRTDVVPHVDSPSSAVEASCNEPSSVDVSAPSSDPTRELRDDGWVIEPMEFGGVRLQTSAQTRWGSTGCLFGMLLPLSLIAWFMYHIAARLSDGPADWIFRVWTTLIQLGIFSAIGLPIAAIVLQILWLLFVREKWEASKNSLLIRQRILGFAWDRQYHDAELFLDPYYQRNRRRLLGASWRRRSDEEWSKLDDHYLKTDKPFWRLAVKCDGHKHYMIRLGPGGLGTAIGGQKREELDALVAVLAEHTGWNTISFSAEATQEAQATAPLLELSTELQKRGFRSDVDEQLRLIIRQRRLKQVLVGITLGLIGGGALFVLAGVVASHVQAPSTSHDAFLDSLLFWFLTTPALLACAWFALCGVMVTFASESWIVGRNRLIVRSQLFGWTAEHHFVDGALIVKRVVEHRTNIRISLRWKLELQDRAGKVLTTLRDEYDDDLPRLLGALLSEHTGWPLRDDAPENRP